MPSDQIISYNKNTPQISRAFLTNRNEIAAPQCAINVPVSSADITVNAHLMLGPAKLGLEDRTRTFFDRITIRTGKADISVTFTVDSIEVNGEGLETLPTNQRGSVVHPGFKIVLDGHQNCWIELNKNVQFLVLFHHYVHPRYFQMKHLGFYIADGEGLTSHTNGLLGMYHLI